MNYIHHPYPFSSHAPVPIEQPVAFDPAMAHPSMMHPVDGYFYPHPPFDMVDFYHQPIMDYEEYAENLSRPRLTKEQVETLEAQFQAHPKPSSNIKRQLAAQTNLSLPRVANWFQNRRAKAKQQKRQEEFERMQKAKAEAEEAARGKSEAADPSESNQDAKESQDGTDKDSSKPSEPSADERKSTQTAPSRPKHQKTRSESAREATFASLQRALNAAVAAQCGQSGVSSMDGSVSPTTLPVSHSKDGSKDSCATSQSEVNSLSPWEAGKDASISWTSQAPQESLGYPQMNGASLTSVDESMAVPELDNTQHQEWAGQEHAQPLSSYRAASDADASYNAMQYQIQPEVSLARRGSSDELADTLEGIGINAAGSHGLSQLGNRTDRAAWKETGKELDLAARRKRPRPAAIGTSRSSSMLQGSSAMSPTTRLPGYSTGHTVKQSKSAQNLNSRYAGVRKASAAQRSPLNLSTFTEAGALSTSKAEMSTMLQPVTTGSLAPPTPLTPEELHHLLPNTPTDSYCLSAQPTSSLFPTTQSMQINIASPPATPLAMDMISPYQYQNVAPPMSAPAHYTSFPDYSCDGGPLTGRSWTDGTSMPSPETSFQGQVQAHGDMSSMAYEHTVEQGGHSTESGSGSPSFVYSTSEADMQTSTGPYASDSKRNEWQIMEFPEQREAHRFVAQQLPSQKPKAYTFANNTTPNNFYNAREMQ